MIETARAATPNRRHNTTVRLSNEEQAAVEALARKRGLSLSSLLRTLALREVEQESR
jgi:hypothetical protein